MGGTASRAEAAAMATRRSQQIGVLYESHHATVRRLVARRACAGSAVVDDACQTAWERLCTHDHVDLDSGSVLGWVVVTAVREAWRQVRRDRQVPVDCTLADMSQDLPCAVSVDPLQVAIDHEHFRMLRERVDALTVRERQFVVLAAAGFTYAQIAQRLGVSVRTTERQILRGRRKLRDREPGS